MIKNNDKINDFCKIKTYLESIEQNNINKNKISRIKISKKDNGAINNIKTTGNGNNIL